MLQFIKTQHCNNDTMKKKYSRECKLSGCSNSELINLASRPFLLCTHIRPIPYRSHGPDTLRFGQRREHWVLYKSILRPKHFAAPGTPGKIIKRLAWSSAPPSFLTEVGTKSWTEEWLLGCVLRGNLGSAPFSLQPILRLLLKSWNCCFFELFVALKIEAIFSPQSCS